MTRRKRLGQHFLADRAAVRAIVDALAPTAEDVVLEIGPGRGALTAELVKRTPRVVAVELDSDLVPDLRRHVSNELERYRRGAEDVSNELERYERGAESVSEHLVVVHGDVLRRTFREAAAAAGPLPERLLVLGNLPYSISKPIAMKMVREREDVGRAVLMFQREVARRITAPVGGRAYGPMAVLTRRAFEVRCLFDLPPGAFRPAPQVWSTVTAWVRRAEDSFDDDEERRLRRALAVSFARRRRTLHNNLRTLQPDPSRVERLLSAAGVEGSRRPEQIAPAEYDRMAEAWSLLEDPDPA